MVGEGEGRASSLLWEASPHSYRSKCAKHFPSSFHLWDVQQQHDIKILLHIPKVIVRFRRTPLRYTGIAPGLRARSARAQTLHQPPKTRELVYKNSMVREKSTKEIPSTGIEPLSFASYRANRVKHPTTTPQGPLKARA